MARKIVTRVRLTNRGTYTITDIRQADYDLMLHAFAEGADGKLDVGRLNTPEYRNNRLPYKRLRMLFLKGRNLSSPGAVDETGTEFGPITKSRRPLAEVVNLWELSDADS